MGGCEHFAMNVKKNVPVFRKKEPNVKKEPNEEICKCDIPYGIICKLREDGRILCPFCNKPIRSNKS